MIQRRIADATMCRQDRVEKSDGVAPLVTAARGQMNDPGAGLMATYLDSTPVSTCVRNYSIATVDAHASKANVAS